MKKLLKYLTDGYMKETVLAPLFKCIEAVLELFVPLVVAAVIDSGIGNGDKGYVTGMCAVLVGLGLTGLAFSITAQFFAAKAAAGFSKTVGNALFRHIQSLSYTDLDTLGTSTLITRMTSDLNQVQTGVNMTLRLLLRSPFIVFGAMIMAFTIDIQSALIFAAAIPVLSAVVFGIMLAGMPLYGKVRAGLDKLLGRTRENLSGARVIRAFCIEDSEIGRFRSENDSLTSEQLTAGRISALMNPLTFALINLAVIVLIWVGAVRVDSGILTQGQVVALYNYMSQILVELIKLASLIITITKAAACGKRIQSVLDSGDGMNEGGEEHGFDGYKYSVEFRNVSLKYRNAGDNSLEGISFTAEKGSVIGIIGGTGSGKTSLVNMIPRFYDPTSGDVYIDGINAKDYRLSALRERIGVVPQKAVLFKGTIRENMRWRKADATDEEIYRALDIAQAREIIDKKEHGLDCGVEQGGGNFSGGQRQRLTIARAIVGEPDILILDDSASALDFATDAALRKALASLTGTTVFIVSQRTSSIMHADRIIVLDDGKAVGIGTHEELLESCDVYREIYDSQFRKEGGATA
ncbi:MAG: ABC transporter ATP-binding protein [Ruminiclostridium sp.]|nr:ABC transporter ATP-binding protein [Ruminiclostridium sp.]